MWEVCEQLPKWQKRRCLCGLESEACGVTGCGKNWTCFLFILFFKDFIFIYLFLERGKGKEKERKRNINVWLPHTLPLLGTWPATEACALTGNRTGDPLVCRPAQSTEPHQPGQELVFKNDCQTGEGQAALPTSLSKERSCFCLSLHK